MKVTDLRERMIVALDFPSVREAEQFLNRLSGLVHYVKVGMELFYAAGAPFIERLQQRRLKVFLDLKLHDIPHTVNRTAQVLTGLGVSMFNLHAQGGLAMMEAAREGVEQALTARQERPALIAVTHLTSTDQTCLNREIGIPGSIQESVLHYACLAKRAGLDGVVSAAQEVSKIKSLCGSDWLTVTPGIRPAGFGAGDQKRVVTPQEAVRLGCDYLVIGRPLTQAVEPAAVFAQIIEEAGRRRSE